MIQAADITLHDLKFLRVHVEVNEHVEHKPGEPFSFLGTNLGWSFDFKKIDEDRTWWVAVGFATNRESDEERPCPYNIDVQAAGFFAVEESFEGKNPEKFAVECGAGLVYGAIREMVSTATARSAAGPLMLPTPKFVGLYEKLKKVNRSSSSGDGE